MFACAPERHLCLRAKTQCALMPRAVSVHARVLCPKSCTPCLYVQTRTVLLVSDVVPLEAAHCHLGGATGNRCHSSTRHNSSTQASIVCQLNHGELLLIAWDASLMLLLALLQEYW